MIQSVTIRRTDGSDDREFLPNESCWTAIWSDYLGPENSTFRLAELTWYPPFSTEFEQFRRGGRPWRAWCRQWCHWGCGGWIWRVWLAWSHWRRRRRRGPRRRLQNKKIRLRLHFHLLPVALRAPALKRSPKRSKSLFFNVNWRAFTWFPTTSPAKWSFRSTKP